MEGYMKKKTTNKSTYFSAIESLVKSSYILRYFVIDFKNAFIFISDFKNDKKAPK